MNTQLQELSPETQLSNTNTADLVLKGDSLDRMMRLADFMSQAKSTVPVHLKSPGDCLAVIMQSMQWGMNPFAVAQKTFLVHGTLGYEAQLVNAVITSRAPITGRLNFEWFGNWGNIIGKFTEKMGDKGKYKVPAWSHVDEAGLGVRVYATFIGEQEPRILDLMLTQAQTRNSTLWAEDPRQQLAYLATKRWARLYCPDVILGVYTSDEINNSTLEKDMGYAVVVPNKPNPSREALKTYSDEEFAVMLPKWADAIESGKANAEHIIKMSSSKVNLTDEQIQQIRDLEVVEG